MIAAAIAPISALAALACLGLAAPGCDSSTKKSSEQLRPQAAPAADIQLLQNDPFQPSSQSPVWRQQLNLLATQPLTGSALWAVAHCDCTKNFSRRIITASLSQPGVLPQPLVPSVREGIVSDSSFQFLRGLPPLLNNVLTPLFANDDKLATSIRDGISKRMQTALQAGSRLATQLPFRFDHFGPLAGIPSSAAPASSFVVSEQAAKWVHILSLDALWQGTEPLGFGDHGLQLVATMRTFSEWEYMFGLQTSAKTARPYGGLSLDLASLDSRQLGAYNLRAQPSLPPRLVTGSYSIGYPKTSTIDLVTNGSETWTHQRLPIRLEEQAMSAYAGALAFSRLRPESRRSVAGLFGADRNQSLFPLDIHEIGLLWLSSFGGQLGGGWVDRDSRTIFGQLRHSQLPAPKLATLREVTILTRSLMRWVKELADLSQAQLSADAAARLTSARQDLRLATQNSIQTTLARHVRLVRSPTAEEFVLVEDPESMRAADLATAAETLSTLAEALSSGFQSPLLEDRVVALASSHFRLAAATNAPSPQLILWNMAALHQLTALATRRSELVWVSSALQSLGSTVASWDGGLQ
jgi:hypothetical protein